MTFVIPPGRPNYPGFTQGGHEGPATSLRRDAMAIHASQLRLATPISPEDIGSAAIEKCVPWVWDYAERTRSVLRAAMRS